MSESRPSRENNNLLQLLEAATMRLEEESRESRHHLNPTPTLQPRQYREISSDDAAPLSSRVASNVPTIASNRGIQSKPPNSDPTLPLKEQKFKFSTQESRLSSSMTRSGPDNLVPPPTSSALEALYSRIQERINASPPGDEKGRIGSSYKRNSRDGDVQMNRDSEVSSSTASPGRVCPTSSRHRKETNQISPYHTYPSTSLDTSSDSLLPSTANNQLPRPNPREVSAKTAATVSATSTEPTRPPHQPDTNSGHHLPHPHYMYDPYYYRSQDAYYYPPMHHHQNTPYYTANIYSHYQGHAVASTNSQTKTAAAAVARRDRVVGSEPATKKEREATRGYHPYLYPYPYQHAAATATAYPQPSPPSTLTKSHHGYPNPNYPPTVFPPPPPTASSYEPAGPPHPLGGYYRTGYYQHQLAAIAADHSYQPAHAHASTAPDSRYYAYTESIKKGMDAEDVRVGDADRVCDYRGETGGVFGISAAAEGI